MRSILIFFENGRVGNQLFQYCGIKNLYPNHIVILFGLKDLQKTFCNLDAYFIGCEWLKRWKLFGMVKSLFRVMVSLRLISGARESNGVTENSILSKKGLFSKISLLDQSFFQSSKVINTFKVTPAINSELLLEAEKWLAKRGLSQCAHRLVFVHIRRGDYLLWPSSDFPAYLDFDWYEKAISLIKKMVDQPIFIVMGDDSSYLKEKYRETGDVFISTEVAQLDFAIMSYCQHGILSASTFAWWGGWFSRIHYRFNGNAVFIAPKYWVGHRRGIWTPPSMVFEWLTYID